MTAEAEEDFLVAIRRLIRSSGWGSVDVALFETLAAEHDALRARIEAAEKFATSERDSIRGQYGMFSPVYAGYANACDDFLAALAGDQPEATPEPPQPGEIGHELEQLRAKVAEVRRIVVDDFKLPLGVSWMRYVDDLIRRLRKAIE